MRLVRDDAPEKLQKALTLIQLAQQTTHPEMLAQHLSGASRIVEMVMDSMLTMMTLEESVGDA